MEESLDGPPPAKAIPPPDANVPTDASESQPPAADQNASNKRSLEDTGEPGAKRVKTAAENAVQSESIETKATINDEVNVNGEISALVSETKSQGEAKAESEAKTLPKGTAPVKQEYLIKVPNRVVDAEFDDDAAEAKTTDSRDRGQGQGQAGASKRQKKGRGANEKRYFGRSEDAKPLCSSRAFTNELAPRECRFSKDGGRCKLQHDVREYLADGRRPDLAVFDGNCPIYDISGDCPVGWKCLFVQSHSKEVTLPGGKKELILLKDPERKNPVPDGENDGFPGVVNVVSSEKKMLLSRKKLDLSKSQQYIDWLDKDTDIMRKIFNTKTEAGEPKSNDEKLQEYRAAFVDPPFKPSEKRRVYFGRETPVLAPLTTQGNLPFRRLCVELGAGATYSEMAVGSHVLQGQKSEWALLKAHQSEATPPRFEHADAATAGYDNSRDLKFGAQIAANKSWVALKTTQVLSEYLPHLRLVDLNCGCPIDMVFKQGAGSALLDMPSKLERMIRGMNAVSGEVPITCKLRLGVKDGRPTAQKTIERLGFGDSEASDLIGAPGCAAITLHGRSRQQRYRSLADWGYIAECANMIKSYQQKKDELADTTREPDASTLPNGEKMYFIGNGDCYSHVDYFNHVENARVDTVMIARGALIKPWIFEEIERGQFLDKSASERLSYVEKFARYGMEAWGTDEMGIGTTRKFLLEYLSFTHRYIPVGLLEHLPPRINDRPPAYRGRDDLETLLTSNNYKDWIKISEMFLGPAAQGFQFEPKHKSNAYEVEAEG